MERKRKMLIQTERKIDIERDWQKYRSREKTILEIKLKIQKKKKIIIQIYLEEGPHKYFKKSILSLGVEGRNEKKMVKKWLLINYRYRNIQIEKKIEERIPHKYSQHRTLQ